MEALFLDFELIDITDAAEMLERCEGQNMRKTLIIFQTKAAVEELRSFLGKVLAAAQLDLSQDTLTLAIMPNEKFSFNNLCQYFDIQSLIAFGVKPESLGIHFQMAPYELLHHEGRHYVFVDDLQAIYEERQQGGKRMSGELWKILKTLFLK